MRARLEQRIAALASAQRDRALEHDAKAKAARADKDDQRARFHNLEATRLRRWATELETLLR